MDAAGGDISLPSRVHEADPQAGLRRKLTDLREEMDCEVPFVQVDWFLATASLPPLYHDILGCRKRRVS